VAWRVGSFDTLEHETRQIVISLVRFDELALPIVSEVS